jgi:hypothetical protein
MRRDRSNQSRVRAAIQRDPAAPLPFSCPHISERELQTRACLHRYLDEIHGVGGEGCKEPRNQGGSQVGKGGLGTQPRVQHECLVTNSSTMGVLGCTRMQAGVSAYNVATHGQVSVPPCIPRGPSSEKQNRPPPKDSDGKVLTLTSFAWSYVASSTAFTM